MGDLTIKQAQERHPWNVLNGGYGAVPYSAGVRNAETMPGGVPHIQGSHAVLHAAKSLGKIAAVFEALDHKEVSPTANHFNHRFGLKDAATASLRAATADLFTAALRIAHLYAFDLSDALEERAREKNGVGFEVEASDPARESTAIRMAETNRAIRAMQAAGVAEDVIEAYRSSAP
jgi:hypothetical protein